MTTANENTLEIEIPLLLPGVQNERDACLQRLESTLQGRKGISRAHLLLDRTPAHLCLHYDPVQITIEDVRRLAARAGAEISNRYHHDMLRVEGMDCSD